MSKPMKRRGKRKPPEFSKLILMLLMLTYFLTVAVGVRLCFIDVKRYLTLAMLIGAPTATAIGFYAWKTKCENVLKYRRDNKKETDGAGFDPANIASCFFVDVKSTKKSDCYRSRTALCAAKRVDFL